MSTKKSQHVVRNAKDGWDVKKGGASRASRRLSENRALSQAVLKHPKKLNFSGCDFWDLPKNS